MNLAQLILKNFRNHQNTEIVFAPGINFFIGSNGAGKTNILEAISILSNLRSFRNISDAEIIRWGEISYYCCSRTSGESHHKFEIGCGMVSDKLKKKVKIDDSEIKRASDYYGKLLTVIFSPLDINIISGPPETRRRFFDGIISKIDIDYFISLNDFKKIVLSRNKVLQSLKEKRAYKSDELDIWDGMLSGRASLIIKKRSQFLKKFKNTFQQAYTHISGGQESVDLNYAPSLSSDEKERIQEKLLSVRERDILSGSTNFGPHRDDYLFYGPGEVNFNHCASQGQKRTAAIALKAAEAGVVEESTGDKTVILVDDILTELDEARRNKMLELLRRGNQVIFTMVNTGLLDFKDFSGYKNFFVEPGGFVREI